MTRAAVHYGPTVASSATAIRELGEMLLAADQHPDFGTRLTEVEHLADRVSVRLGELRDVVRAEYLDACGFGAVPPAGQPGRSVHGGYPDGGS